MKCVQIWVVEYQEYSSVSMSEEAAVSVFSFNQQNQNLLFLENLTPFQFQIYNY